MIVLLRFLPNCHCVGYCVAPAFAGTYAAPAGLGGDRAETGWHLYGDPLPVFLGPTVLWSTRGLAESVLDIAWGVLYLERGLVGLPSPSPSASTSAGAKSWTETETETRERVVTTDLQSNRASRRAASFLLRHTVTSLRDKLFTLEVAHGGTRAATAAASASGGSLDHYANLLDPSNNEGEGEIGAGIGMTTGTGGRDSMSVQREPHLTVLHRVYRLLKHAVANDRDDIVRHHASAALSAVDEMVREQFSGLFEKEKAPQIKIL